LKLRERLGKSQIVALVNVHSRHNGQTLALVGVCVNRIGRVRWTKWRDWDGSEADIPYFVLVKSRGEDRSGKRKDKHYAVVCRSDNKLRLNPNGQLFDPRNCRTISGKLPGDSQNTALLSGDITQSHRNGRYRIAFAAMLVRPWQVILLSPIPV
ncbi:MAG: hypothetical protein ABR878_15765, partial [Roseiarcus sp.]